MSLGQLKSKLLPSGGLPIRQRLLPADYADAGDDDEGMKRALREEARKHLEGQIKGLKEGILSRDTKTILKAYEKEMMKVSMMKNSSLGAQVMSQKRSAPSLIMSQSNIKSEPELIVYNKREIPSSAAYLLKSTMLQDTCGGKFSTANVPGFITLAQRKGKQLPGPSEYGDVSKSKGVSGGKFNSANVPGFIHQAQRIGKTLPSSLDYTPSHRVTPTGKKPTGNVAKFSNSNSKSDVDWLVYYAQQIPGPGAYDVDKRDGIGRRKKGQKFSTSFNIKSFAEEAICKTMDVPGPKYVPGMADEGKDGFLWDVGGLTKYSTSVDQLVRAANKDKRRKVPKYRTQQKKVRELAKSKRRKAYLDSVREEEAKKEKDYKRKHRRRFLTYTSPYSSLTDLTTRPSSPSSPSSPVKLQPLPGERVEGKGGKTGRNRKKKWKGKHSRKYMTIKETIKMSRKMLQEEEQRKKNEKLMNPTSK
jgi:hypothetical protein|eukprot:g5914.t1